MIKGEWMGRIVKVKAGTKIYRTYRINDKYDYDKDQINIIIEALEFYRNESIVDRTSDYVVFDITINVNDSFEAISQLPDFNISDYDDNSLNAAGIFKITSLSKLLPREQFFYRWTREFKKDHGCGEHYHLMVIANHVAIADLMRLQQSISDLEGVKTVFISPRKLEDDDHRRTIHFHWLSRETDHVDGLNDAVYRYAYRTKLSQKIPNVRKSFDGTRELISLAPLNMRSYWLHQAKLRREQDAA